MTSRRALLATPFAAGLVAALPAPLRAQETFPDHPLRLVVPFTPGGAVDLTGRLLAEMLPPILGQSLIVENRGGAGGNLGGDNVAKAPKDGYSLLLGTATILAANKFLFRKSMPFDPITDLAPVCRVATGTVLLVVNPNRPWKSFAELIAAAKEKPGRVTMGSSGTGAVSHLSLAAVNKAAGVEITHVPYRGGAPAIQDLLAGNIDMMFDVIPALMPHVREGRMRALAVGSAERVAYVPELRDVPGMAELLPGSGIDAQSWYAVMAPAGTPADRIATLHRAVRQVAQSDAFRAKMEPLGFAPVWDESPAAFGNYLRAQEEVWKGLVEVSGATLD
ncbi:tripartite tricarboxylate transporter substrate binding protein [Pseudoroseomonas wenyumeiae]|uniref:Tripartite tricarboxylate transporter substrate binding protein n=1 Tax=Teichococcus wenyumeiae TaxID=2478470 RepID=A0A3A9K118_9PROT|nr:tripartite tricarboxylate transporter substrate binding protein [Pseudoroseomonas wenyumeiae]RKK05039.1 tripartite tricarboxylate transporter substrate binding protein [Pseudoroseomonas wenyumeiae]RMI20603.1 tripartite tricarboxylate transporter substrate binding protein [Pseudoroseomonas wenyumeiae]